MSDMYLKMLGPNREAINGGTGAWPYPKWTDPIDPIPCKQGWHVCTPTQAVGWLPSTANSIWFVDVAGTVIDDGDKTVVERARLIRKLDWSDRTARLFAADCAERVLYLFEEKDPRDLRPREAIVAARRFAEGEASRAELDATRFVAWAAAAAGAGAGARAAVGAATGAARDAAGAAAWNAARDAARAAAWAAAWAAARDNARDAAWAVAWAAERDWQAKRLLHLIGAGGER